MTPVWLLEVVLLPVLVLAAAFRVVTLRRRKAPRLRLWVGLAVALIDVWLILVATSGPLGPHPVLLLALVLVNGWLAFAAINDLTGFHLRRRTPGMGRYRSVRTPPGYRPGD